MKSLNPFSFWLFSSTLALATSIVHQSFHCKESTRGKGPWKLLNFLIKVLFLQKCLGWQFTTDRPIVNTFSAESNMAVGDPCSGNIVVKKPVVFMKKSWSCHPRGAQKGMLIFSFWWEHQQCHKGHWLCDFAEPHCVLALRPTQALSPQQSLGTSMVWLFVSFLLASCQLLIVACNWWWLAADQWQMQSAQVPGHSLAWSTICSLSAMTWSNGVVMFCSVNASVISPMHIPLWQFIEKFKMAKTYWNLPNPTIWGSVPDCG